MDYAKKAILPVMYIIIVGGIGIPLLLSRTCECIAPVEIIFMFIFIIFIPPLIYCIIMAILIGIKETKEGTTWQPNGKKLNREESALMADFGYHNQKIKSRIEELQKKIKKLDTNNEEESLILDYYKGDLEIMKNRLNFFETYMEKRKDKDN